MIILIILTIVLLSGFSYIKKLFKNKETILEDVSLKEENISSNSGFALMLEQSDGTYQEITSNSWPSNMVFNSELSGCIDTSGKKIENAINYVIVDNISTMKTVWMHLSNNDSGAPVSHAWTMSRLGKFTSYRAWIVSSNGNVNHFGMDNIFVVRPVFYLESNIEFSSNSGNGSINNPYMIL